MIKNLLIVVISIFMLAACSSNAEKSNSNGSEGVKELTFLSNFPSETMDPHLNFTPLRAGVVETLIKINEDLDLEPWLAESWEGSDNGQTWTFKIRDNVTFHNGKKLDAEGVKASLERNIQVSEAMKAALKIQSIEADGQTLIIKTEESLPAFPSELVHPNASIIDVAEENIELKPVGTGAFVVDSYESGSKLTVKKFKEYWDGEVQLDQATLTFNEDANARTLALQSGDADIVYRPSIESIVNLEKDKSISTNVVPSLRTHLLMYNMKNESLGDIHVRKAFDALINRQEVVDSIMAGQAIVSEGPFLPEYPFTPSYEEKAFGVELAKQHLEEAGFEIKDGKALKDGKPLSLKLFTYSYRPELPLIGQLLQSNAKKLGITIDIQIVENIDEYLSQNDDWDLAVYSLNTAPRGDASYFLNNAYMKGGAMNFGNIQIPELTKKIEELNKTVGAEERSQLAKEAITMIDQERLHSFIIHPSNFAAYKSYVNNWSLSKSEYYVLTKDTDVVKE